MKLDEYTGRVDEVSVWADRLAALTRLFAVTYFDRPPQSMKDLTATTCFIMQYEEMMSIAELIYALTSDIQKELDALAMEIVEKSE